MAPLRVALVGAGNIAGPYAERITETAGLELVGVTDVDAGRAAALAATHGARAYASLGDLLADDAVDVAVNLTSPSAHVEVTRRCLEAGKHVHSEKPAAQRAHEVRELAELAARNGVRLSCAPASLLGEAQQTAWKLVRDGDLGTVRAAYAEANWGRIERWHPSPEGLYESGPLVDVGIYPLTILTGIFGPVRRVSAYATTIQPERLRKDGVAFSVSTPDFQVALLELESGLVVRLTATFWVGPGKQRGLELHGDRASLWLADWGHFDARLERTVDGEAYTPVPHVRQAFNGVDWAAGLVELGKAIEEGRPHRLGAEHAAHVVEVLEAARAAAAGGGAVDVRSDFPRPEPLDWAR